MRTLVFLILTASLAGCATQAEVAAQKEREVEQMVLIYGRACVKMGYQSNSDTWRNCMLNLNAQDNLYRYNRPTTTSCFGHRGFLQCTTF